jgi:anti-sigma factor RsiW
MPPPTLRDHVRATLDAREPSELTTRADREAVLARVRPRRRPRPWAVLAVSAGLAVVIGFVFLRRPPPDPTATQSVDLYLRVQGEPESQALTFHLDVVPPSSGAR